MSVLISGALVDGAGIPLSGCHIILKSRMNTSEVVMRTIADVVTGNNGVYSFEAQAGKYCVYLKQDWRDEYSVGDIAVYDDSKPGTLNDFLIALDEGDLKPDVVKRFEEMVAQAQQSAEAAAESERLAGQHAVDAQKFKENCQTMADNVQQNAETVAGDKNQVAHLASSASQNAARAEQAVKDADMIVQKAVDKLGEAATLTGEAKASAEAAAKSEQSAKQHRDEAQRIVDDLKGTSASTTQKGLVQLCSDTDNDSEELAATPKAVKTVMDETKTKAPLDSPAFTGTPTTPTPPDDAAGLETANAAFVRKLLAALVGSSPEALDTLNELAAALGNDPNFATTVTNALAGKQPLNEILTSLSGLVTAGNKLPYFSDKNVMALANLTAVGRVLIGQNSKNEVLEYLGLKAAATMEPQSDIRDRTPGRLALSGMYGFGQAFSNDDTLKFNGHADFVEWMEEAVPGRYAVSIADSASLLADTRKFNGIIDVMWSPFGNDGSDPIRKYKTLLCFNQYYGGEHSIHCLRYSASGNVRSVTANVIVYDGDSLALLLSRTAGNGPQSYYSYPAVGSLLLAVYQGMAVGDKEIKIGRGEVVPGSRLGPVSIECAINNNGTYVSTPRVYVGGAGVFSFPGRYQALSGYRATYGDMGFICLFVRVE
ncbi:TPA: prophage tail fiber N-terminal domain-containing protein [Salmonella enterica subsp. enterica serovar Bovismorbificans]|nr:prophage tail fiber N-terminal domain-containing protein [Salmonella enterica subsp. enterica serovar Bovismorbificans]HCV7481068.1 prophage tail fiber N-terminal domain-containing protein [Salmonella enterica subsp. enterica serovar Bovismorbificans]HCV7495631.1 prophage tail fiber N-terminal domain-containing protein [Salmonella enterica subsp. enterica serovar Bovismorbificans]HCV7500373.1 prophage tail fiber N-terminal domain-containing protein [Salmonella enterica subsp. enterica serovar